jgi:hypothetical protein
LIQFVVRLKAITRPAGAYLAASNVYWPIWAPTSRTTLSVCREQMKKCASGA